MPRIGSNNDVITVKSGAETRPPRDSIWRTDFLATLIPKNFELTPVLIDVLEYE